ncbi:MAG: hypothetical protein AAF597_18125, partial [Bacteroidota bacterium]
MYKCFIFLVGCFLGTTALYATPQHPDLIIVGRDTTRLVWWLPSGPLNKDALWKQRPGSYSTACWDGYYRLWEIRNDSLFLNAFLPCDRKVEWSRPAGDFYPDADGAVFAHWVDQEIYVASDTLIKYYDVYPIYAEETGYSVSNG